MKKLVLLALLSALSTQAWSADWTPYLKGMQDSCSILNARPEPNRVKVNGYDLDLYRGQHFLFNYNDRDYDSGRMTINSFPSFPNALKNDVYSITLDYGLELHLRNATAFGYPLRKINISEESYGKSISIHFDPRSDIRSILPQFTYDIGITKIRPNTNQHYLITYRYTYNMDDEYPNYWFNSPMTILSSTRVSYHQEVEINIDYNQGHAYSSDDSYYIGAGDPNQGIRFEYGSGEDYNFIRCSQGYTPG